MIINVSHVTVIVIDIVIILLKNHGRNQTYISISYVTAVRYVAAINHEARD